MKTLDERITDAETTLEQAKASEDAAAQAKAETRLEALREAKEFHTKEFERVGKKIRSEGGDAKEQEIAEMLGVSVEEAKQIIADHKAAQDAIEDAAEKERKLKETAEKERDDARAATEAANKLAEERLIKAELKIELSNEGARKDRLAKLLREADLSGVTVEDEEVKNLAPVIEALKKDEPDWFGAPHESLPTTPGGSGDQKKGAYKPRYNIPVA